MTEDTSTSLSVDNPPVSEKTTQNADSESAIPSDNPPVETEEAPGQTAPEEIIAPTDEAGVLPVETTEPKEEAPVQPIESEEIAPEASPAPEIIPPTQTQAPITQTAPAPQNCQAPAEPIEREISEEKLEENFIQRLLGNLTKANQKRKIVTQEHLEKILADFSPTDKITNDKVETLLGVSDRAASRYLNTLFKQGKIMKFGSKKGIFYQKYS